MSELPFDEAVANELLRYARMVVARGYIHNSLGNIAVRVPHPGFPHGVAGGRRPPGLSTRRGTSE